MAGLSELNRKLKYKMRDLQTLEDIWDWCSHVGQAYFHLIIVSTANQ